MGTLPAIVCAFTMLSVSSASAQTDAQKIMKDVYGQFSGHDISMKANFQVFDRQGQSTKKEFVYLRSGAAGESKVLAAFTAPREIRGVVLLSINARGAAPTQYLYTPATERVRSVVQQERSARFIGTDFTFEDIGEPALNDFSYKLLSAAESIDGHKTYKIEATPVEQGRSQYKYIYFWVAQDAPVILFAEFYDAQGRKMRVLHATSLKHESGVWGARHTEMRTVADGTRTVLTIDAAKFNVKLDERLFTPQGMGGALASAAGK
jgi:Protein of unknown function (DUF1329).